MIESNKLDGRCYTWNDFIAEDLHVQNNILDHIKNSGFKWMYGGCTDTVDNSDIGESLYKITSCGEKIEEPSGCCC